MNYPKSSRKEAKKLLTPALAGGLGLVGSAAYALLTFGAANHIVASLTKPAKTDWQEQFNFTPFEFEVDFLDVCIPTVGGRLLQGWLLQHTGERRIIVMAHGYRGSKEQMLGLSVFLWKAGFNVLLFNYRGHGPDRKSGELLTLGERELEDFQAAVNFADNYLHSQGIADPIIGALGGSMGAAVALTATARNPKIRAVWADSSFSSRKDVVAYNWQKQFGMPIYPIMGLTDWLFFWRTGHFLSDFSPAQEVAKIAPRPIYFLHSESDQIVPLSQSYILYEAASGLKTLWVEKGIDHCGIYFKNREEYRRRLILFFEQALEGLPDTTANSIAATPFTNQALNSFLTSQVATKSA